MKNIKIVFVLALFFANAVNAFATPPTSVQVCFTGQASNVAVTEAYVSGSGSSLSQATSLSSIQLASLNVVNPVAGGFKTVMQGAVVGSSENFSQNTSTGSGYGAASAYGSSFGNITSGMTTKLPGVGQISQQGSARGGNYSGTFSGTNAIGNASSGSEARFIGSGLINQVNGVKTVSLTDTKYTASGGSAFNGEAGAKSSVDVKSLIGQ